MSVTTRTNGKQVRGARLGDRALLRPLLQVLARFTVGVVALVTPALAQSMPVPPTLQATILHKLFSYDRMLQGHTPTVVIAAVDTHDRQVMQLEATFAKLGDRARVVSAATLPAAIDAASVVYIMPDALSDEVSRACVKHGVLSMSGMPAWTKQGRVSIAIGLGGNGKPEIIVNLSRSKLEGHELSSRVLRLARVVH